MASLRVHEDQENRLPEFRQKPAAMAAQQKRPVLAVIDSNKQKSGLQAAKNKQPLGILKGNNKENVQTKEPSKGLGNSTNTIPPVAQFEAFKVYEDTNVDLTIQDKLKQNQKNKTSVYDGTETRFFTKTEAAEILKLKQDKTEFDDDANEELRLRPQSPMSIEKTFDDSLNLAEDVIFKSAKGSRECFLEMEEYRTDIYNYLREHELRHRPKPGYMKKQPDVTANMRTILVDWLVEVAEEYKLQTETLYLAVNYIDRFLSYMSVVRAKLQLVGTAAMFLASKYEEIYPPDIGEFVYITDETYNKRQVIRMEHLILKVLAFDTSVPTPLTFIQQMCISSKLSEKTLHLAMYLSELSLLNGDMYLEFLPSVIAASAIAVARHTLGLQAWNDVLGENTGYELKHLRNCIEFLTYTFEKAPGAAQHAIQDKYKQKKYMHVSQLSPNPKPIQY